MLTAEEFLNESNINKYKNITLYELHEKIKKIIRTSIQPICFYKNTYKIWGGQKNLRNSINLIADECHLEVFWVKDHLLSGNIIKFKSLHCQNECYEQFFLNHVFFVA